MNFKKYRNMITIIFAVLTAIGVVWSAIEQSNDKRDAEKEAADSKAEAAANKAEAREFNRQLRLTQDSLLLETQKNANAANELADVYKQLSEAQNKLNEGQEETIKKIMGDGYIKMLPILKFNRLSFEAHNVSNYPLYNVNIVPIDYNKAIDLDIIHLEEGDCIEAAEFESCYLSQTSLPILPNKVKFPTALEIDLPGENKVYIEFRIYYKHTLTIQYSMLRFNYEIGKYEHIYKIFETKFNNPNKFNLLEEDGKANDSEWNSKFHFKRIYPLVNYKNNINQNPAK